MIFLKVFVQTNLFLEFSCIVRQQKESEIFVLKNLVFSGARLLSANEVKMLLKPEQREFSNWWWLNSPGSVKECVDFVFEDGYINHAGCPVNCKDGSVRPALTIVNFDKTDFNLGDKFIVGEYEFVIISWKLAWLYKQDIGPFRFNRSSKSNATVYKGSDIKDKVDTWFDNLTKNEEMYVKTSFKVVPAKQNYIRERKK